MANNTLAIRFTENDYATKSEVAKELKTTLIDSFWKIILEYRSSYAREVPIRTINNSKLSVCLCPSVNDLISGAEMKIISALQRYNKTNESVDDERLYKLSSKIEILKHVALFLDLDVDENYLRMLITGKVKNVPAEHNILISYSNAIDLLAHHDGGSFDEDIIAELYSMLSDNSELISLYRTSNDEDPKNKVIIDRVYTSAPSHLLNGMMNSLISYIQTGSGSLLTKSASVCYYINYAKPFAKYNELMGILLAKYILCINGLESLAFYLPIESLLADKYMDVLKINIEVQRSDDLTYFLRYFINNLLACFEKTFSIMNNVQALTLMDDYYADAYKEANIMTPNTEIPAIEVEEKKEVIEEKEEKEIEVIEVKEEVVLKEEKEEEEEEEEEVDTSSLAVAYVPPALSEKALKRLEQHLLESDPELRKPQAKFYARHCTMGKRYTIQQFKKEINCAYETARTSMDGLVTLGYYRQEMVKNKKVYTPIKRK